MFGGHTGTQEVTCSIFADIHFIEYMGAFYAKVMAAGLVNDGFCSLDSFEVLENVEHLRQEEELEKSKRTLEADGLVSMQNSVVSNKRECATKILDPSKMLR